MRVSPSILVVDPSPATHTALQWACVGCTVIAHDSLLAAMPLLYGHQHLMVVVDLALEGVEAFYDGASPALRDRLLFVSQGSGSPAQRRFAARLDAPLLYKPLSPQILSAAYEAFRSSGVAPVVVPAPA